MIVARNIKRLRKKMGLSQQQLADALGFWQTNITGWETGRNEPSLFSLILLADFFGVTLDELCKKEIE